MQLQKAKDGLRFIHSSGKGSFSSVVPLKREILLSTAPIIWAYAPVPEADVRLGGSPVAFFVYRPESEQHFYALDDTIDSTIGEGEYSGVDHNTADEEITARLVRTRIGPKPETYIWSRARQEGDPLVALSINKVGGALWNLSVFNMRGVHSCLDKWRLDVLEYELVPLPK